MLCLQEVPQTVCAQRKIYMALVEGTSSVSVAWGSVMCSILWCQPAFQQRSLPMLAQHAWHFLRINAPVPATRNAPPGTRHPARATRHAPPGTRHPVSGCHPARTTRHAPSSTRLPAPATRHTPSAKRHPARGTRHVRPGTRHPAHATRHAPPDARHPIRANWPGGAYHRVARTVACTVSSTH
jgi:hypothetical protein